MKIEYLTDWFQVMNHGEVEKYPKKYWANIIERRGRQGWQLCGIWPWSNSQAIAFFSRPIQRKAKRTSK